MQLQRILEKCSKFIVRIIYLFKQSNLTTLNICSEILWLISVISAETLTCDPCENTLQSWLYVSSHMI